MLVEMSRVRIIGLKEHFFDVIDELQTFGKMHFDDISGRIEAGELPVSGMRLFDRSARERDEIETQLQRTRAILKGLIGDADVAAPVSVLENECLKFDNPRLISCVSDELDELEPVAADMVGRLEELEKEFAELTRYEPLLEKIEPVVARLMDTGDVDAVALLIEKRYRPVFEEFRKTLEVMTNHNSHVVIEEVDEESVAAVAVFTRPYATKVRTFLAGENINQIKLPAQFEDVPLTEALGQIKVRIGELPDLIKELAQQIAFFGAEHLESLAKLRNACVDRIAQLDSISMFGETRYTFVITGWVPTADVDELRAALAKRWPSSVVVEQCEIQPKEFGEVPVAMENKGRSKPFQLALGIWGLPRYGSIDPTSLLSFSFPFIFGMIVGDAGYGLTLLLICLFLRAKYKSNQVVEVFTGIMVPTAIMTMIFGVFYFEFFGDLAHIYIPGLNQFHPIQITESFSIPFLRTSSSMQVTFLIMAIAFGVFHVMSGLILGIVNGKRGGHKKHIFEKAGILTIVTSGLLLGALGLVPALTAGLPEVAAAAVQYIVYALLAFGFVMAIYGGGIMGAVETIEAVSHMASYARIMAVGLVGALLADAANKLAFVTMPNAAGIFIALILHILNFVIILFSPSIHAFRLNFLEFFGGFFERGTTTYKPFVRTGEEG